MMPAPAAETAHRRATRLRVNGSECTVLGDPGRSLLEVLREELSLTGSKYGCGEGECGACMVLVDGVAVRSCRTPIRELPGHPVITIEGVAEGDRLHPVQQAFLDAGAFQCGFCTPGMIIAAVSLLGQNPSPTEEEIRGALHGNLCRCGGYLRILDAVQKAASRLRPPRPGEGP
ncbi:MAG: (2Fe-2S)-binding protein [Thermoplasmata archaeon]